MKITFANDYTTPGGRTYKGGTTAEVNNAIARSLIFRGKAVEERPADAGTDSAAAEATETPAKGKGKD